MKIGDLVSYQEFPGARRTGIVTDVFEDEEMGYLMYEVVVNDPFDRGWYIDTQLEVVSESKQ